MTRQMIKRLMNPQIRSLQLLVILLMVMIKSFLRSIWKTKYFILYVKNKNSVESSGWKKSSNHNVFEEGKEEKEIKMEVAEKE